MNSSIISLVLLVASGITLCSAIIIISPVKSDVYKWESTEEGQRSFGSLREILSGETRDYYILNVTGISLDTGAVGPSNDSAAEGLILVKAGTLSVSLHSEDHEIGQGSAVLMLPGDHIRISNHSDAIAEYFILEFISRAPLDAERGQQAGGSQIFDWNQLEFTKHDKGGVRRYFDRPTAMSSRFEMHATTLKPGLKSHEPHTHRAAEIILMIEGETEEQIGDDFHKGIAGDFYFLESEVPHAIENIGQKPATYYAFQFE